MKVKSLFALLITLVCTTAAKAVVLRGIVSEVRDGQTVVVKLQNGQNLIVSLKAVDAPELEQDHGDLSRQHLANLVLNRPVEVDFSASGSAQVVGRVMCGQVDMSLQVIRDGSAWYDRKTDPELSESERQVLGLAEKLAREERRGLWRDGSPVPPWEWRQMQYAKNAPSALVAPRNPKSKGLTQDDVALSKRSSKTNTSSAVPTDLTSRRVRPAKPPSSRLNTPGEDADFRSKFSSEFVNIVYFYAEWCPACRSLTPLMTLINDYEPDMQVLFMDIADWGTPVAKKYNITSVPHLKIYDKSGALIAEGAAARNWMRQQFPKKS